MQFTASGQSTDVYLRPPVHTVDEAVERMEDITRFIEATCEEPALDGLGCFNHLYTIITKRVRDGILSGFFDDAAFLTELDVVFANRYFDALRADAAGAAAPRVWKSLLNHRENKRIEPMQFAVAGVNAHINFDLGISVVDTCTHLRTEPRRGTQHADYLRINDIFADEIPGLRRHYENDFGRAIDGMTSPILNLICNWSVVTTRNSAWDNALKLWDIRRRGEDESGFVNRLDRLASLGGDLLLTPIT